jgi:hypothetical protein
MPALPPLASVDDVASRLGRDLSQQEAIRLEPLLADASAQVRRYCRRDFLRHVDDVLLLRAQDGEIVIPSGPVESVSGVVAVGGAAGVPDVPVWWTFDGIDRVRVEACSAAINLPEAWGDSDAYPGTYRVTCTHGPAEVPDDVVMVVANAALSVLTAPTAAAGVVSEQIGPYSYRLEKGGGGVAVSLSQADIAQLKDYRGGVRTLQARLR